MEKPEGKALILAVRAIDEAMRVATEVGTPTSPAFDAARAALAPAVG